MMNYAHILNKLEKVLDLKLMKVLKNYNIKKMNLKKWSVQNLNHQEYTMKIISMIIHTSSEATRYYK